MANMATDHDPLRRSWKNHGTIERVAIFAVEASTVHIRPFLTVVLHLGCWNFSKRTDDVRGAYRINTNMTFCHCFSLVAGNARTPHATPTTESRSVRDDLNMRSQHYFRQCFGLWY
jgi:hypothetical protein